MHGVCISLDGDIQSCEQDILNYNPNVIIFIDYPGFNLRLANKIKGHFNIPITSIFV